MPRPRKVTTRIKTTAEARYNLSERKSRVRQEIAHLLNENQDPTLVDQIYAKVSDILTNDEKVTYICAQKKPVVNPRPDALVLTTRRFIIYRPKILGRVSFDDHTWRNLTDAHLEEGVVGATISLKTTEGKTMSLGFLPKVQARKVYAIAQEQEERVHEERRRRALEEKRAAAGGIVMNQPQGGQDPIETAAPGSQNPVERLRKLKEMVDAGLMSPGEFEAKRAEIIEKM